MMKFDYIIGNPPYQEETDSESTRKPPLYHKFMDECNKIANVVELITPARFLFDAGYTPHEFNQRMLNDKHFKIVDYNPDSSIYFKGVSIEGGVVISYRNSNQEFETIKTFIPFKELTSILNRTKDDSQKKNMTEIVFPALSYKFSEVMKQENPESLHRLRTSAFRKVPEVFWNEPPQDGNIYIPMLGLFNSKRVFRKIREDYLEKPDNFECWKVFLPKSNGSPALGEKPTQLIGTPQIGEPKMAHTQSFISLGSFPDKNAAEACMKYIKTKFARILLGILKITPDNPRIKWRYVPLQDFTSHSDIDWTQSISEIDQQLYNKYGLSEEEIDFIETHVKEME